MIRIVRQALKKNRCLACPNGEGVCTGTHIITLKEPDPNRERPTADLSTPGVNWSVVSFPRKETSSPDRTRTYDKAVNSRLLYQLSYRGI